MTYSFKVYETGVGAKVEVVPLLKNDFAYPKRITITATAASAKNATSVTISASTATSGQTLKLPAGTVLPFLDPVSNSTVIAQLSANASIALATGSGPYTGTGTLSLVANHLVIANNSTSSNFITLGSRTTANFGAQLSDEKLRVFDSALFDVGQIVGGAGSATCEGAFSSLDAGTLTVRALTLGATDINGTTVIQTPGNYLWLVVTTAVPDASYSTGTVARGVVYCTDFSIDLQAGTITKQSLPFALNGPPFFDDPVVI